jgi:hypothetical protein
MDMDVSVAVGPRCAGASVDTNNTIEAQKASAPRDSAVAAEGVAASGVLHFSLLFVFVDVQLSSIKIVSVVHRAALFVLTHQVALRVPACGDDSGVFL